MLNLDFHNLLNADEFVLFVREVLEIRENGLKFTSYKRGADKGIDIRCTNSEQKIIGQVKLYNPANYRGLISSLREEVVKCKKNCPARYILCIGNSLNPLQATEILNLFEGYIRCEEDIVDAIKLNKYINQPEYERLKKQFATLLVPDLTYVEHIIDRIINRRILNNTEDLFEQIRKYHSLYYNTSQYRKVLEKLNQDRIVIITGNPGVGKTTTARMIIQQLLIRTWDHVYKLDQVLDIQDIFLKNKKQLFFVDDFWGSQMQKRITNRDYLRQFVEVIEMVHRSEQHYLIMTSRTYIVQAVLNHAEEELQQTLNLNNFTILLEGYTREDKAKIFFNHLQFYNCNRDIFEYFRYGDELECIIEHRNYSPRHIEYFLKYIYTEEITRCGFYSRLNEYLNKPYEYWKKVLDLQSDTARLILLLILVSSDPIRKEDLRTALKSVYAYTKTELSLDIKLLDFEEELRTLENLFITSDQDGNERVWIQFNSPGIKDYVLEYLKDNIDCWGKPLIQGACFFNQLYYVFDTKEEEFDDFDSEIPLTGMKIVLSSELQEVLKNKILQDFDHLNLSTGLFCEITDQLDCMHVPDEIEYFKLIMLEHLFRIENNFDIRDFIIDRIKRDILKDSERIKMMPTEKMLRLPYLIRVLQHDLKIDPVTILITFHNNIKHAAEYVYFYEFKEIYPREFSTYYTRHIKEFRKHIRELIIQDIWYYEDSDEDWKIDFLIDSDIEELRKNYGIRLNKKFVQDIIDYSGKPFSRLVYRKFPTGKSRRKRHIAPVEKKHRKDSLAEKIVSSYIDEPGVEIQEPARFIRKHCPDKALKLQLLEQVEKEDSPVHCFLGTSYSFFALMEYLLDNNTSLESISEYSFLNKITDFYFNRLKNGVFADKLADLLMKFALEYFKSNRFRWYRDKIYYTDSQIEQGFKKRGIECPELNFVYPFLVKIKKWYTFLNYELLLYFAVQAIIRINNPKDYSEIIAEIACGGDREILEFLDEADRERFRKEILDVEIHHFMNTLNVDTSKGLVLSFIRFFNPDIDLTWNKKNNSFESGAASSENCFVEELIRFIGVEFEVMNIDVFFDKDCYWGENLEKFKLSKQGYKSLYNRLLVTLELIDENGKPAKSQGEEFHLNLYQFAKNSDNYQALKEVGAEDYILGVYQEIQSKLEEYIAGN